MCRAAHTPARADSLAHTPALAAKMVADCLGRYINKIIRNKRETGDGRRETETAHDTFSRLPSSTLAGIFPLPFPRLKFAHPTGRWW